MVGAADIRCCIWLWLRRLALLPIIVDMLGVMLDLNPCAVRACRTAAATELLALVRLLDEAEAGSLSDDANDVSELHVPWP